MGELDPRIKIRAPLRCDGIGRLDCAEDLDSGMRLAVRWLPLDANGDAAARACEKLPTHPTLPRIRQTGQVGGSAFVAMDFPDGQLLSTFLGERLDTDLVLRVAAQVSDALATVHEQGVVHGELSSDSVLLVPPDRAYLWDMPLVIANRLTDRRGENRLMQNLVKSAPYLSPERAQGAGASREADVYSLGAVLCIAAGAPLPVAATTLGVVHMVASGAWFPRVPSSLPDPWRSMLARMVSTDPSARPISREVARVFAQGPTPAGLPTVPELPAVRLPPELLAAADALMKKRPDEVVEVRPWRSSEPTRTLEMPIVQAEKLARDSLEMPAIARALQAPAPAELKPVEAKKDDVAQSKPTVKVEQVARAESAVKVEQVARAESAVKVEQVAKVELTVKLEQPTVKLEQPTVKLEQAAKLEQVAPVEMKPEPTVKLEPVPAPKVEVPAEPAVQLTSTISVAQDLATAGAVALSDEELSATRSKLPWLIAASMAVGIVVLTVVAVNLATSSRVLTPEPARTRVEHKAPVAAPVKAPQVTLPSAVAPVEEELAPLPPLTKKHAAPAPRRTARPAPPAPASPSAAPSASAEAPAPAVPAQDFSFLDGAEAPKSELKRPEL